MESHLRRPRCWNCEDGSQLIDKSIQEEAGEAPSDALHWPVSAGDKTTTNRCLQHQRDCAKRCREKGVSGQLKQRTETELVLKEAMCGRAERQGMGNAAAGTCSSGTPHGL